MLQDNSLRPTRSLRVRQSFVFDKFYYYWIDYKTRPLRVTFIFQQRAQRLENMNDSCKFDEVIEELNEVAVDATYAHINCGSADWAVEALKALQGVYDA